jgi:hypothetical protein
MQGGKNWILPTEININRFFRNSHWLEIWKNHLYSSMGPNGGIVALNSESRFYYRRVVKTGFCPRGLSQTNEKQHHFNEKSISELDREVHSIQTSLKVLSSGN